MFILIGRNSKGRSMQKLRIMAKQLHRLKHKFQNGHCFILKAIDYFTKWMEATSYANVTKQMVLKFIKNHIICRYGFTSTIITDNRIRPHEFKKGRPCAQRDTSFPVRPKGQVDAQL